MLKEIVPDKQNIDSVFSGIIYHLDFYQRDYKWKKEQIITLLEDVFHKFKSEYKSDIDATPKNISEKYTWYYLNTFVTNTVGGNTYIVDGQQRLTTLTLFLIKLYHLCDKFDSKTKKEWIKGKISGNTSEGVFFWMGQKDRKEAFKDLYENNTTSSKSDEEDLTIKNIYKNYGYISNYLDKELNNKHKVETFTLFFIKRLVLINLEVGQTYVPMVFEVINDRGEKLKPYEILKGKMLGQIDKTEVEEYNQIWEKYIHQLQEFGDTEIDNFFRLLFRAKYVNSHSEYKEFDGDYHKTIFLDKWNKKIKLKWNPVEAKKFIKTEFQYFIKLYIKLLTEADEENSKISKYLLYNDLNDQDRQFLLILSACLLDDKDENEKIKIVSKLFDKYYSLLMLNGCYDSNKFTESIIKLNEEVRNKSIEEIEKFFNNKLIEDINSKRNSSITNPFVWAYFKEAGYINLPIRFSRYLFARVEHFIANNTNNACEDYYNLVRNTGPTHGFHIEHILAHNEDNLKLFNNNEELFENERNRLGVLLLLKGRDNQSSGAEKHEDKLKTYVGTNLWNQTLLDTFYHSNKDFEDFMKKFNLNFKSITHLSVEILEERNKLLFEIIKIIWK